MLTKEEIRCLGEQADDYQATADMWQKEADSLKKKFARAYEQLVFRAFEAKK